MIETALKTELFGVFSAQSWLFCFRWTTFIFAVPCRLTKRFSYVSCGSKYTQLIYIIKNRSRFALSVLQRKSTSNLHTLRLPSKTQVKGDIHVIDRKRKRYNTTQGTLDAEWKPEAGRWEDMKIVSEELGKRKPESWFHLFQKYNFSLWNILNCVNDLIFQHPTSIWLSTLTLVKWDWVARGGGGYNQGTLDKWVKLRTR